MNEKTFYEMAFFFFLPQFWRLIHRQQHFLSRHESFAFSRQSRRSQNWQVCKLLWDQICRPKNRVVTFLYTGHFVAFSHSYCIYLDASSLLLKQTKVTNVCLYVLVFVCIFVIFGYAALVTNSAVTLAFAHICFPSLSIFIWISLYSEWATANTH